MALSKGREYLLLIEDYPSRISLSKPYHELFNQIRSKPHEEWALLGYQAGQRRLILPRVAEKGLSHSVPPEVMAAGIDKARNKAGISDLIGDTHSHPRPLNIIDSENTGFSLRDMYSFLYYLTRQRPSDPMRSVMFVAEGNENIAAFVTKRSLELVRNNFRDSYENFAKQWYERYGWNYKGLGSNSNGGLAQKVKPDASNLWQINKGIAFHFQLALYRGAKDEPLLREHPARNNI